MLNLFYIDWVERSVANLLSLGSAYPRSSHRRATDPSYARPSSHLRYQSAINASVLSTSPPSPRPSNASTPDLSLVPGIYHDPAYQTIELCFVSAPPSAESDACAAVRAAAPTILPGAINASIPTLLAHVNRLFTSHLRLQHFDGNVWNVTEFTSQASLQGGDYYANGAYGASADSVAEFDDVDGGFGITGGFWGAGEGVRDPQAGVSVKERSEVWFEKV